VTVVRVLPNVTGLDKHFDYLVPEQLADRMCVGTIVRAPLHGRSVSGWVLEVDPAVPDVAPEVLKEITRVTGAGPASDVIELGDWAAGRWVARRRHFMVAASPERAVTVVPAPRRTGARPEPRSPAASASLAQGGGVLRLPPSSDPLPAVLAAVALGPTIVVVPENDAARLVAARLRRAGLTVASMPDEWAAAAGGVDVVVGSRSAVWAPCPGLAAGVVLDEHDEALQDEASPTWHARDVLVERCRRAGAPWLLVSPVPTLHALELGPLRHPPADRERRGWPMVDVIDRTGEVPWKRSLITSELVTHLRDASRRVVCVSNTTGRARLLACRTCRALARCERCDAAVAQTDDGRLRCARCELERPLACLECRSSAFANLRPGVTRLREELEAAAGRPVAVVTGTSGEVDPPVDVFVGTEAVLHRVGAADVVAFLDLDAELFAPRYRAGEQALALLARAARMVGPRSGGGRLLLQTFTPGHEVIRAAVLGDPDRVVATERERRRLLGFPPFGALAEVAGVGAEEFVATVTAGDGVDVGGGPDRFVVRAPDAERLGAALRAGVRPSGARLRIAVDPPRV
jgi:primosomal protein N' (replication factor Y) (superfamily II helicase)